MTPGASSTSPADRLEAIEQRSDATSNVRPFVLRADERKRVAVHDVARTGEERGALEIRVPADVVDVQMREEDDVDLVA